MELKFNLQNVSNLSNLKNFINQNKIKLILFSETHGFLNEIPIQEKILEKINFKYFLYELFEDKKITSPKEFEKHLKNNDEDSFSIISNYGELKPTISLAKKFSMQLIGCDLKNTGRNNTNFRAKKNWSKEDLKKEEILFKKRELKQKETIDKYLKKGKVFASIGTYHLRKKSYLMNSIRDYNFIIIYPKLKGGKIFGESMDFEKKKFFLKLDLGKTILKMKYRNVF